MDGVSQSETNIIWSWFGDELPIKVEGTPKVTVVGEFTGNFTATFSEGTIELKGNFEEERSSHFLTCPILILDDITFNVGAPA